ncbi:MAG: hypothetical protein ACK5PS_04755 [Desulfopila sp.]
MIVTAAAAMASFEPIGQSATEVCFAVAYWQSSLYSGVLANASLAQTCSNAAHNTAKQKG